MHNDVSFTSVCVPIIDIPNRLIYINYVNFLPSSLEGPIYNGADCTEEKATEWFYYHHVFHSSNEIWGKHFVLSGLA
jgi:hypothetical protein